MLIGIDLTLLLMKVDKSIKTARCGGGEIKNNFIETIEADIHKRHAKHHGITRRMKVFFYLGGSLVSGDATGKAE